MGTSICKKFISILILSTVLFSVEIPIMEQKETGVEGTQHFNISLFYDCNKTLFVHIADEVTSAPVSSAIVRLFYEERYTPLLGTGLTNASGDYQYTLIGDPKLMRNIFLVVVEKQDFITKEAHFVLPRCDEQQPSQQPSATPSKENRTVPPSDNASVQQPQKEKGNISENISTSVHESETEENQTVSSVPESEPPEVLPCRLLTLLLLILSVYVFIWTL